MTDRQVAQLAKITVLALTAGALFLATHTSISLVSLLLLGYDGVAQFLPGVVLGLFTKRVTTSGVFAGMVTGISIALFLILTGRDPYLGLNAGFFSLCFNFAVTGVITLLTPVRAAGFDKTVPALAASRSGDGLSIR